MIIGVFSGSFNLDCRVLKYQSLTDCLIVSELTSEGLWMSSITIHPPKRLLPLIPAPRPVISPSAPAAYTVPPLVVSKFPCADVSPRSEERRVGKECRS